jgi:hypothetical protein
MTSSVIRRNAQLSLLDDRFEHVFWFDHFHFIQRLQYLWIFICRWWLSMTTKKWAL